MAHLVGRIALSIVSRIKNDAILMLIGKKLLKVGKKVLRDKSSPTPWLPVGRPTPMW